MPTGSSRPGPWSVLAVGSAAAVLLAGCGPQQAGAAAIVGDQRVTDAEILDTAADVEAMAQTGDEAELAADLVLYRVVLALIDHIAEDRDVTAAQGEIDSRTGEIQRQQELAGQEMPDSLVEAEARAAVLAEGIAETAPAEDLTELREATLEGADEELAMRGELMQDLSGDELDAFVEEQLAEQEELLEQQLPQLYLNEVVIPQYLDDTEIDVSPRYGTFDQDTLHLDAGASALSAEEPGEDLMPGFPEQPGAPGQPQAPDAQPEMGE
ncbi:hypothetical protein RIF23_05645 [Lipingzhangella sp. LS1_29]|uniref:SurA-like protein n=1 Tax=Lipingzhangella rawalii TaxID=2055835 RepID=A0ABU2H4J9_9ACTN|nr:hypothetical protein [Lipingzhangella rawalii]MDS1269775.1 hypothetical protein [Lipingzhangella rawalii]